MNKIEQGRSHQEVLTQLTQEEKERREMRARQLGCSVDFVSFISAEESAQIAVEHLLRVTRRERGKYWHWSDDLASIPDSKEFLTAGENFGLLERMPGKPHILTPSGKGKEVLQQIFNK